MFFFFFSNFLSYFNFDFHSTRFPDAAAAAVIFKHYSQAFAK